MSFKNDSDFFKELHLLLQKHNVIMITSGNKDKFIENTKHLQGFNAFFTRGELLRTNDNTSESVVIMSPIDNKQK